MTEPTKIRAAVKPEPQTGLFDRTIEDPELESFLEDLYSEEVQAAHETFKKAHKAVYDKLNQMTLEDGEKVRCGQFLVVGKQRSGGGFEVPQWTKTGIGKITRLDE